MNSIKKSLAGSLILATGGGIAVILVAFSCLSAWETKNEVETTVTDQAVREARLVAEDVSVRLDETVSAGNAVAGMIQGLVEGSTRHRSDVIAMLKTLPQRYPSIFGSWMAQGPGLADPFTDPKGQGNNAQNLFTPYWTKTEAGDITFSTFNVKAEAQWYAEPLKLGRGIITEPYFSESKVLLTSVSFPVKSEGLYFGVAGVDIKLNDLSKSIGEMRPFHDGRVMLISSSGKWLVHPDTSKITTAYNDEGSADVTAAIADQKPRTITLAADGFRRIVLPFRVPGADAIWVAVVDVPNATFTAPVYAQVARSIAGNAVILILLLGLLYMAATRIVRRPLMKVLAAVEAMGKGRYEVAIDGTHRADEVGRLSFLLDQFRHALAQGESLKSEQERLNTLTEGERSRQRTIDSAKAEDLREFMQTVEAGFRSLSTGDLTVRMTGDVASEFEPIRAHFNGSVAQLEETIGSVVGAIGSMRDGLDQITKATGDLSQRTEQQAASLEETVAALSDVVRGVDGTAQSAHEATATASLAQTEAEKGGSVVFRAVAAMSEIEQSSKKIGSIISVIDEIAFQTNLLALNAGVEAARAGDAGRGFAVVAQEVRGLAQRSAEAAKEIKDLIQTSSQQVAHGVELVSASGRSLDQIVAQVGGVSGVITQMARAAREQAVSLKEVSTAADRMDRVTQQNAAMVEQTSAAARSLSGETEQLATLVEGFRTKAPVRTTRVPPKQNTAGTVRAPARVTAPVPQMRTTGRGSAVPKASSQQDSWEEF